MSEIPAPNDLRKGTLAERFHERFPTGKSCLENRAEFFQLPGDSLWMSSDQMSMFLKEISVKTVVPEYPLSQFMITEMVADASDLRWPPGSRPNSFTIGDAEYRYFDRKDQNGELLWWRYANESTSRFIKVFNE